MRNHELSGALDDVICGSQLENLYQTIVVSLMLWLCELSWESGVLLQIGQVSYSFASGMYIDLTDDHCSYFDFDAVSEQQVRQKCDSTT